MFLSKSLESTVDKFDVDVVHYLKIVNAQTIIYYKDTHTGQ